MALTVGSVAVDDDGNVTGSGLSRTICDALVLGVDAEVLAPLGDAIAPLATALATAIVDEITTNAVVTVTIETSDSGLQRTPNPNNADTPTQGPATQKTLTGTIA